MPNHITNVVKAAPHVISSLMNGDGQPDFNCVIPMPSCLVDFQPYAAIITRANLALGKLTDPTDLIGSLKIDNALRIIKEPIRPEDIPLLIRALTCFQETGYLYWYDWAIANWGTKWNAYEFDSKRSNDEQIAFDTAWTMPQKIAKALSEKFPDDRIEWQFADEDVGSNCGVLAFKNGQIIESDIAKPYNDMNEDEKRKWREFAVKLRYPGTPPCEHGMDENYNYINDPQPS